VGVSLFDQSGRWSDVRGSRLPALERNLCRFRSYEIILFLQATEALKADLEDLYVGVQPKVKLSDPVGDYPSTYTRKQWKSIAPWKRSVERLLELGLIDFKDRGEVVDLIEYRNSIAHNIEDLFADIGTARINREIARDRQLMRASYKYQNLRKIDKIRRKFSDNVFSKFVMTMRLDEVAFESTERFLRAFSDHSGSYPQDLK
jgi:hypothetical protein